MGKYDALFPISKIQGTVTWQEAMITILTKSANEIAESNRLKRIELKIKLMNNEKYNPLEAGARSELREQVDTDLA
jgi:hypothetical protein